MPAAPPDPALIASLRDALAGAGVARAGLRAAAPETDLFREGLLDSITLPRIVLALEAAFAVKIPLAEFERWNFESLAALAALVERRAGREG